MGSRNVVYTGTSGTEIPANTSSNKHVFGPDLKKFAFSRAPLIYPSRNYNPTKCSGNVATRVSQRGALGEEKQRVDGTKFLPTSRGRDVLLRRRRSCNGPGESDFQVSMLAVRVFNRFPTDRAAELRMIHASTTYGKVSDHSCLSRSCRCLVVRQRV